MTTDTKFSSKGKANLIDKIISIAEILSALLLVVPYASIAAWLFSSFFLEKEYFIFFPTALLLFLPTGIFSLFVQFFRIIRIKKTPITPFNGFMLGGSVLNVIIGIFAYMLLYVAVG